MLADDDYIAGEKNTLLGQPHPTGSRRVAPQVDKLDVAPPFLQHQPPGKGDFRPLESDMVKLSRDLSVLLKDVLGTLDERLLVIRHLPPGYFVGDDGRIEELVPHDVGAMVIRVKDIQHLIC